MIVQTFTSEPPIYPETCADSSHNFPGDSYSDYLCTPPRLYSYGSFEFVNGGIAAVPSALPDSTFELWMFGNVATIHWPSWGGWIFRFNGTTGKFIGSTEFAWSNGLNGLDSCKQDRSGVMWGIHTYAGSAEYITFMLGPATIDSPLATSGSYSPAHFAGGLLSVLGPDMLTDTMLGVNAATPFGHLSVFRISTGELLRNIDISGTPVDINWENGNRAYVHTSDGMLFLMDIVEGRILGTMSFPVPTGTWRSAYDPYMKRLVYSIASPDAEDGGSTTVMKGYKPFPLADDITNPALLDRAVVGRRIRTAARVIGGGGEPVVGSQVSASLSNGNGTLLSPKQVTDSDGYAYFEIDCTAAGTVVLTVETETIV